MQVSQPITSEYENMTCLSGKAERLKLACYLIALFCL